MPDIRFKCAEPTGQPSSGYASRIPQDTWSRHEDLIRRLHACGTIRDDILHTLVHDHDFRPSIGQLRDQMARWGLKSPRKNKTRVDANREDDISACSFSGSDGLQQSASSSSASQPHVYTNLADDSFACFWSQYSMGNLPYETAIEIETLADTLFLGGRYVAAFNLYSSIYYSVPKSFTSQNLEAATVRFRALLGCLRSSGNTEQRLQVVSIADSEIRRSAGVKCCKPDDLDVQQSKKKMMEPLMVQFREREHFRRRMAISDNASTVGEIVKKLQLDENRMTILNWCFDRLNTPSFVSEYNEQLSQCGSGVAYWTYGGSQSTIYWYLVVAGFENLDPNIPRFTIRHTSGHQYTFSTCETFAIVAAMVSSEPWLFSLDHLPLDGLLRWTQTLKSDIALFETIFQHAIKTTMVPNFTTRLNKTKSDVLAASNGYASYRLPNTSLLKNVVTTISQVAAYQIEAVADRDLIDFNDFKSSDLNQSTLENLTREYLDIVMSYVDENCAYGTSHQIREKLQQPSQSTRQSKSAKSTPVRSFPGRPSLAGFGDPALLSPMRGSARSSFRSFQSTHLRTKKSVAKWPELEAMSLDINGSSHLSRQFLLSVGVK